MAPRIDRVMCFIAIGIAAMLSGCARTLPSAPPSLAHGIGSIARRHYDQACREEGLANRFVDLAELFDTAGVREAIRGNAGLESATRQPGGSLDFVSRYHRDGSIAAAGVWDATLAEPVAMALAGILVDHTRPLEPLLEPEGFHTRLVFGPGRHLELRAPIQCVPHLVHEAGKPPTGLPNGVRVWVGRFGRRDDPHTAAAAIELDADGRVIAVERAGGAEGLYARALAIVAALHFDPALVNGEPRASRMTLSFVFGTE